MRVSIKSLNGVQTVAVSLEKGEAVATFAPGNHLRYQDLLHAIEKNGFVVKGSKIVADGMVIAAGNPEFELSGTTERFKLEPANGAAPIRLSAGSHVEVTGTIPEVAQGKGADVIRYDAVVKK